MGEKNIVVRAISIQFEWVYGGRDEKGRKWELALGPKIHVLPAGVLGFHRQITYANSVINVPRSIYSML